MSSAVQGWRSEAHSWINVRKETRYDRVPPNLLNFVSADFELRRFFISEIARQTISVPAQDVYTFSGAVVSDLTLLFHSDGAPIQLSHQDHHTLYSMSELSSYMEGEIPSIGGDVVFPFKAGKNNFGHVFVEMLPRLELVAGLDIRRPKLLFPHLPRKILEDCMLVVTRLYGARFEFEVLTTPLCNVSHLIVPGLVTKHNSVKSPIVREFAEKMVDAFATPRLTESKIYVSRRNCVNRRMQNEGEIQATFEKVGFVSINPERLSIAEQVSVFASATEVAGPLGAGLSNIMFAPERCRVLMIDPGMYDFFFYDLASLRQQDFSWLFVKSLGRNDPTLLHEDYWCDPALVGSALSLFT